jgi:hypothetical protein
MPEGIGFQESGVRGQGSDLVIADLIRNPVLSPFGRGKPRPYGSGIRGQESETPPQMWCIKFGDPLHLRKKGSGFACPFLEICDRQKGPLFVEPASVGVHFWANGFYFWALPCPTHASLGLRFM